MHPDMSWVGVLEHHAGRTPSKPLAVFGDDVVTYQGMAEMLAIALKGLPRDSYRLMTKYSTPASGDPLPKIDQFRSQLRTDYIDILLLHCLRPPTWETARMPCCHGIRTTSGSSLLRIG